MPDDWDWVAVGAAVTQGVAERPLLSWTDVVKRSGLSDVTVRKIRNGESPGVRPKTLARLSQAIWGRADLLARVLAGELVPAILETPDSTTLVDEDEIDRRVREGALHHVVQRSARVYDEHPNSVAILEGSGMLRIETRTGMRRYVDGEWVRLLVVAATGSKKP